MPTFNHALFTDANLRLTTSVWDDNVASWMMKNQNYVMSSGGVIWVPLTLDASGNLKTSVKDSALPTGAATQATLASVLAKLIAAPATEAKQDTLNSKDFATQTTLAAILAKLIAAPATEATIASILTQLGTTGLKKIIDPLPPGTNLMGKIGIDQTTPGTTNAIAMISSIESIVAAPVVGVKSVTTTAAEIFAGGSVKTNRRLLAIRNEDAVLRLRVGPSSVTQQNGFPIEPGATAIVKFDPATAVSVYGISEGAALNITVMEV